MLKLEQLKKPDLRVQIVEQRAAFDLKLKNRKEVKDS
jgi:hypothetical protein